MSSWQYPEIYAREIYFRFQEEFFSFSVNNITFDLNASNFSHFQACYTHIHINFNRLDDILQISMYFLIYLSNYFLSIARHHVIDNIRETSMFLTSSDTLGSSLLGCARPKDIRTFNTPRSNAVIHCTCYWTPMRNLII